MSSDEEIEFVEETRKRKVQRGNVKNSKNEKDSKKEKKAKVMDRDEIVRDPKYWDKFDAFVERILGKWVIFTMDDSYTRDELGKLTFAPRGRNSLKISFDINNHSGTQTNFCRRILLSLGEDTEQCHLNSHSGPVPRLKWRFMGVDTGVSFIKT